MAIDFDRLEVEVREHLENQPYKVECSECGRKVELDITIDRDLDMTISVPVCRCATEE